jgi:hypothetical protein
MSKYIIKWNIGYGYNAEVVEASNLDCAMKFAYESWRDEAENNADYDAEPYTEELADDLGV